MLGSGRFCMGRADHGRVRGGDAGLTRRLGLGLLSAGLLAALGAFTPGTAAAEVDLSGPAYQILAPGDFGGVGAYGTPPPNENSFDQGLL